jgi:hypothetical protein
MSVFAESRHKRQTSGLVRCRSGELYPRQGRADHAAEIAAPEGRILVRENIGLHVAEGRLRLVLDAVVEGLDDVFFEMYVPRMGMNYRLALFIAVFGISEAKQREALALKAGDGGTKNSLPRKGFIYQREGARAGRPL